MTSAFIEGSGFGVYFSFFFFFYYLSLLNNTVTIKTKEN